MSTDPFAAALADWNAGRAVQCLERLRAMGDAALDHPTALQLWALAAGSQGRGADALALLERAVRIAPGDAQAHFNLGVALQAAGDLPRAMLHYQQALRLDPAKLGALNNLSDLMRRRGRATEGWALLERYQAAGGEVAGLEIRLAKLAMDLRRFDDAATWFARAEANAPGDASVEWEHAMLLLARGDFAGGWPRYERRLDNYGLDRLGIYPYAIPRWTGEDVRGRTLLLHREQGLGDMIMFAGGFQPIQDEGADLHLAVHPALARLMAHNFPRARVWSSVTAAGAGVSQPEQRWLAVAGPIEFQAPICSLGALRMGEGPPPPAAYLTADPGDVAVWADRLAALAPVAAGVRRVGVALGTRQVRWSDDGFTNAVRKTLDAQAAAGLADAAKVQWVGLHDRETASLLADAPLSALDPSPWITDLADTAGLIANLDVVVSADTAVAHLAGAMGKPVLLMLWWNADWRWGIERSDAAWYPHVRILRQPRPGSWAEVVSEVVRALA